MGDLTLPREVEWAGYCRPCGTARKACPCHKCRAELSPLMKEHEEPRLPDISHIRALAREVGYAIGVHGSLERDLDLIAAAWTSDAVSATDLAAHLAKGLNARVLNDKTQDKPCGRWSCNIQIDGWFKVIDLSVMPPVLAAVRVDPEPVAWRFMRANSGEWSFSNDRPTPDLKDHIQPLYAPTQEPGQGEVKG